MLSGFERYSRWVPLIINVRQLAKHLPDIHNQSDNSKDLRDQFAMHPEEVPWKAGLKRATHGIKNYTNETPFIAIANVITIEINMI